MRGRHELAYEGGAIADIPEVLDSDSSNLKDWVSGLRCLLHIGSSSIGWGMKPHASKEILDKVHIGIASLRNGSAAIIWAIDHAFPSRIVFEPDLFLNLEDRKAFWTLFCASPNCLDAVMHVNPRWDNVRKVLVVSAWLKGDPILFLKIRDVLVYLMQWRNFSETR